MNEIKGFDSQNNN